MVSTTGRGSAVGEVQMVADGLNISSGVAKTMVFECDSSSFMEPLMELEMRTLLESSAIRFGLLYGARIFQ